MTRQRRFTGLAAAVGAFIALVILLFPLYAVVIASFENNTQLLGTHYNFLPPTPSFANYSAVIGAQGGHIVSTLIVGIGTPS
jgi:ABC-type glycerol-3-phosphate transport system permease component